MSDSKSPTTPEFTDKFGAADVRIEHGATASQDEVVYYVDGARRVEERTLVRKIDLHMFTCVSVLYLLNYLDRQNVRSPIHRN